MPLATFGIALLVGSVLNLLYRRRELPIAGNWVLTVMMVFVLFAVHQGLVMFSPILSSKKLADAVQQEFRPGDVMVSYGTYEDASTLNFYVRQPIHVVNSRTEGDMYYGSLFPDAPAIFDDDASLRKLWSGPQRVFLWVEEGKVPAYIQQSGSYQLARSGGKLILMNRTVAGQPQYARVLPFIRFVAVRHNNASALMQSAAHNSEFLLICFYPRQQTLTFLHPTLYSPRQLLLEHATSSAFSRSVETR